jgi:hypothetical protein
MTDLFHADDNATPLTEAERTDLIPTHISLRGELNELEQKNVAEAYVWAFRRKRQVIDEAFLKGLHRRMFKAVGGGQVNTAHPTGILASSPIASNPSFTKSLPMSATQSNTIAIHLMNWRFASNTVWLPCIPSLTGTAVGHGWRGTC